MPSKNRIGRDERRHLSQDAASKSLPEHREPPSLGILQTLLRNPAMPDGLRRLPNHVVAPLLRALMCIPRTPDSRLSLRNRQPDGRAPGLGREPDYDVIFRDRPIGRIRKYDYTGDTTGPMTDYLWHWYWRNMDGKKDTQGHSPTLEAVMADFRRAWDSATPNVVSGRF